MQTTGTTDRTWWDTLATPWRTLIEPPLLHWLTWWHGRGEAHQDPYFRCHGCRRVVTWRAIRRGGCTCRLSTKLSPAALRWYERVRLLALPFWCVR